MSLSVPLSLCVRTRIYRYDFVRLMLYLEAISLPNIQENIQYHRNNNDIVTYKESDGAPF